MLLPFPNLSEIDFQHEPMKTIVNEHLEKDRIFNSIVQNAIIVLYSSLVVVSVLTNLPILLIVVFRKSLRKPSILLLLNLFSSNLAAALICVPFTLISLLRRSWNWGAFLCKMVPFLKGVVVFVSAGTVTTIAFDRLIRILYTQPIGHNLSAGNLTCRYSLLIWFLAIFLSVPVFHYKQLIEVGIKNVFSYSICVEVWPNRAGFQYTLITFAVAFIVPLCFLIVCHVKILRFLKMHMHRMNNARQVAPTAENETSESTNREESNRKNESNENTSTTSFIRNEARRHSKVMFSLIVGTISYALAWLPWNVFNLYADYYMNDVTLTFQQIYLIFSICYLIAMSSTITNAVIYGYMNTNIQREIKALKNEFMCYFKPNRRSNEVQI